MLAAGRSGVVCGVVAGVLAGVLGLAGAARGDHLAPTSLNTLTTPIFSTTGTVNVNGTNVSGYTHMEGPIYDGNGGILFCELNNSHANDILWRYNIATNTAAISVAPSGGTEGEFYTSDGRMVTADRDTRQISVRTMTNLSATTVVANTYGGKSFNGPNDVVVSTAGRVYFTDPNFENFTNRQSVDGVYMVSAITGGTVTQPLTYGTNCPNGIILSRDETKLYVGVYYGNVIYSYNLDATSGSPITSSVQTIASPTHPDGMTIDYWGNLYVTRTGGVTCYSPTGSTLWSLTVGSTSQGASNVEIYNNKLYITSGLGLYSVGLTQVPEPASVAVLGAGLMLLARRRRRG